VSYLGFLEYSRGNDFVLVDDEVQYSSCNGTAAR
jgi:hypothetical protein